MPLSLEDTAQLDSALSVIHAHRPVRWRSFLEEKHRLCQALPSGPGLNAAGVNGGSGETLSGVERLIGFVDHLSTGEEAGRDITPQVEWVGPGFTGSDWH